MSSKRCLYLFSSNHSPLYAQDILNVLGAPVGHPYTFRYASKYVATGLRETWSDLQDTPVMVVFSLQQQAQFQAPAFIPIRGGYVLGTHREGDSYFVDFRLEEYVGLHEESGDQSASVTKFTTRLRELTDSPYSVSASLGSQLSTHDVDTESDPSVLFTRIGTYLAQTTTFEGARFVRILGIRPTETSSGTEHEYLKTYPTQPLYKLKARHSYDLVLFHAQPHTPSAPASFQVFVDGSTLRTLGSGQFTVASRYDKVVVPFVTADATGLEDRETAVVLEPEGKIQGPVVRLKVRVEADRSRAIGIASTQALALIVIALAGVLSTTPLGVRVGLAVFGALAAVALGLVGASALRPPTLPSASPRPSQTAVH